MSRVLTRRAVTGSLASALAVATTAGVAGAAKGASSTGAATAIFVQPIHDAQWVHGDDGKDHVG